MEILEFKFDANQEGNLVLPGFVNHQDGAYFYNPANHSWIGLRLCAEVKVPDSVVKLTRATLKTRCYASGIMMKEINGEPVQMTQAEIDSAIDAWCDARSIA